MAICEWCKTDSEESAKHHEGPHATWCVHFREEQRGGDAFRSQYMGEWTSDYSWPKMRRMYGSRCGGKSEDPRPCLRRASIQG
jgi:hypothetical protein